MGCATHSLNHLDMALKSTIYKVELSIADIDNNYYAEHALTLARHPSETDERMMVRLVALAFNAWKLQSICNNDGTLVFGAGLSDPDEPDVWLRDFTGRSRVWIEVGQPEDRPLSKACGKSDEVLVYCFHHAANVWWKGLQSKVERLPKLQVLNIDTEQAKELAAMAARSMQLQATIQDQSLMLSTAKRNLHIQPVVWKAFG
jgi:uncharacterized protein YaeQ